MGGKVNDQRPLVELCQADLLEPADRVGHQLVVLRLAADFVKVNVEHAIDLLKCGEAHFAEPLVELDRFGVAVLEPFEPRAALVAQRRVRLGLMVEPDVKLIDVRDGVTLKDVLAAPLLVRGDHDAELGSPVAEEVDRDDAIAERAIDPVERIADHRRADNVNAEMLGDVRRRELDDDGLTFARIGMAEPAFAPVRLRQRPGDERLAPDGEVDVRPVRRCAGDQLARLNLRRELARGLRRILLPSAGQGEARERIVSHRLIRRRRQQRLDRRFILRGERGELACDLGGKRIVHLILSILPG